VVEAGPTSTREARAGRRYPRLDIAPGRLHLISSAARDRVKLAIDQAEEAFHKYEDQANADPNDTYSAALARGKAMGMQEAAHLVKAALHDIDVKSL
jgi:hypothetical protein